MKPLSSSTKPGKSVRLIGWGLLALVMYSASTALVILASILLLQKGSAPNLPWVSSVQTYLYWNGARNIWQTNAACVEFDEDTIYKPKIGTCSFDNPEFKTVLNFSAEGRFTGIKPSGRGIAIVGDSHAMGWGVNDEETFAAVLQRIANRPVYNLGVGSYATERELIRLEKSGLLNQVDTIILAYNSGDLEENQQLKRASPTENKAKFSIITQAGAKKATPTFDQVKAIYTYAFWAPWHSLKKTIASSAPPPLDFSAHYQPLMDILKRYPSILGKRVIVIYSNGDGDKFTSFPSGKDKQLPSVEFADLGLVKADYYRIDDHLNAAGNQKVAQQLLTLIQNQAPSK